MNKRDGIDDLGRLHPALADRARLQSVINEAALIAYNGGLLYNEEDALKKLTDDPCDIELPLARVIELLSSEGNRYRFITDTGFTAKRYDALLDDLNKIGRVVPPPPKRKRRKRSALSPQGKRGRPSTPSYIYDVIKYLVNAWENLTGEGFHQVWHEGAPITNSARFVRAIIEHVAPEHLGTVKKAAERIITARNKAISF